MSDLYIICTTRQQAYDVLGRLERGRFDIAEDIENQLDQCISQGYYPVWTDENEVYMDCSNNSTPLAARIMQVKRKFGRDVRLTYHTFMSMEWSEINRILLS